MKAYVKPKGFLKGLEFHHFMDTHAEFHAFLNGVCEVLCPWPPLRKVLSEQLASEIKDEYHYYMFGRVLGVLAWLAIAKLIQEVFF